MFYLIWEMGILLLLAVGFGVFVGYQLWSGDARSAEADTAMAENARLRQENENLARRLGEAESQSRVAVAADPAPARDVAPEIAMPEPVTSAAANAEPMQGEPVKTGAAAKEAAAASRPAPKTKPKAKPTAPKSAAKPKPAPKAKAPAVARPVIAGEDELAVIKGLGPKAAATLKAGGVTSLAQIAAWTDAEIERWDQAINGRGRIVRDDWVGQARKLAGEG